MTAFPRAVLLDTCAAIWLAEGTLAKAVIDRLVYAALADGVFISPISAWEIGLLSKPAGNRPKLQFLPDPLTWFDRLMKRPGIKAAPLTPGIAINASRLPGDVHSDPADRLIVATARERNVPVVTRDKKILAYAAAGHVQALAC